MDLWKVYLHMASWGTPAYGHLDKEERDVFRRLVEGGALFGFVEQVKRNLIALGLGRRVQDDWLGFLGAGQLTVDGGCLGQADRDALERMLRGIYALLVRLDPDVPRKRPCKPRGLLTYVSTDGQGQEDAAQIQPVPPAVAGNWTDWGTLSALGSQLLGVSGKTLRRWIKAGKVRCEQRTRQCYRFDVDSLPAESQGKIRGRAIKVRPHCVPTPDNRGHSRQ